MFRKFKENKIKIDSVCELLFDRLEDNTRWSKNDYTYRHLDSDLVIEAGMAYSYGDSYYYRSIASPVDIRIPRRHKKRFDSLVSKLNINTSEEPIDFLLAYMQGKYISTGIKLNTKILEEFTSWLTIQELSGKFYLTDNIIYFENIEDAVLCKMSWV